uniref:RING-type domain-containing protein n=1 Tax=Cacopsylla melanoneura TaxID=428564 RepID=A0A8D8QDG2_9HEMI
MTFPYVNLLGIGLVIAVGMFAYDFIFGEEQRQQQQQYEERRYQSRGSGSRNNEGPSGGSADVLFPPDTNIPRRRRQKPVKPTKQTCDRFSCERPASCLCTYCNVHLCSRCNAGNENCSGCNCFQTIQHFDESCSFCAEQIYDCYLTTCRHIFHKNCLERWYRTNPSCITCRQQFSLSDISYDFAAPSLSQ